MARDFELQSRDEEILASIIDGTEYTAEPESRIEELLLELKELIESGGSSSDYATDINFSMDSGTFVITAQLKNKDGDPLGTAKTVDIPLEATVVGGSYNAQTKTLILTLVSGQTISIPIGDIISGLQSEITAQNPLSADLVDDSNTTNKFVTAAEKAQIATNTSDISSLSSGKVDKVTGKGLSTNDYTTAEKNKLAGLSNYDDTEVRGLIATNANNITSLSNGKVDKVTGKGLSTNDYTTAEKNKLAGLSNYDDTEVRGLIATNTEKLAGIVETDDDYIEMENGVRLYIADTEPTGTIPEGSVGIGW